MRNEEIAIDAQAGFSGMVAVITGGARGIGRAIAQAMHAQGARLVLVDCNLEAGEQTVAELRKRGGAAVDLLIADLADPQAIAKMAGEIAALTPAVHVLVNNAGIELDLAWDKVTAEDFNRVMAVNLRAPLLVTQALTPLFPATGGAVVNISSIHASHAFANAIPYACSKAGLVALTRNLALELAPRRIRVNAVCPGYIDTLLWDEWVNSAPDPAALAAQTTALHPLGRRGVPEDVASAVLYLAGPGAGFITGTDLVVDGGLTIRAHP